MCLDGFVAAFGGGGGLIMKAKWKIDRSANRAVAVYEGRKGVVAMATMLMERAQAEED